MGAIEVGSATTHERRELAQRNPRVTERTPLMELAPDGELAADDDYQIVGQNSTYRVNNNNTTTPIEQITARSVKYDVTFTFNVNATTYNNAGAAVLARSKTAEVNAIAAVDHVIGVRGEEDQGSDGNLYNYLVVTVGTDDGERQSDVRIRMDHLGDPSAFGQVHRAWDLLVALGPV
jgi:hypothetical protein